MNHVAIDLGGRESQICVRSSDGSIVEERRELTKRLPGWLKKQPHSRVVVETCAEAFWVADQAKAAGHQVRVIPATAVRALGVGARGVKTDRRDAQVLSEVSTRIELGSVHIPSTESRDRKTLCGLREGLVGARTMLINTVRGWLRRQAGRPRAGAAETFPRRVREHLANAKAELPSAIERQLQVIDDLSARIAEADKELEAIASQDATCQLLQTMPGVGPVTSVRFTAALDQVERFPNAHALQSYLGIVPGENSSSDRQRRTSITKAGSPEVRTALVQASWTLRRVRPKDPMVLWCLEVEKRRGRRVAIVALARKMAGVLYAMWRDGKRYEPERSAAPIPDKPPVMDMDEALTLLTSKRKRSKKN
jgi:transposase